MKTRKKIGIFHILVGGLSFWLLMNGFACLAGLFKPAGIIASFNYWMHIRPPDEEEYQQILAATFCSGIGGLTGLLIAFVFSIIFDRRIGYHWVNSLLGVGVLVGISLCLREMNSTSRVLIINASRLLNLSAVPAYALFGTLAVGIGSLVFLANTGKIFKLRNTDPQDFSFQFEEEDKAGMAQVKLQETVPDNSLGK